MLPELGWAPHGDDGERIPVGAIDPLDPQHLIAAQLIGDVRRSGNEGELDDLTLGVNAPFLQLPFDRVQLGESLLQGRRRGKPTETLT